MECGDFTLILQSGENLAKIDLSQFTEEKPKRFPINTVFVPEQLLANVLQAGKEFCLGGGKSEPHNEGFCNWKENPDDRQTDTRSICRLS